MDSETGLYYYGARYYDPALARFISPDVIVSDYADPQSFNRYSYVRNNPLRYFDPSGHRPLTAGEISFLSPFFNTPNASFYGSIDVREGVSGNLIAFFALKVWGAPAITLGNTIYVSKDYYKDDFASVSTYGQGMLVHETTHVWQNQTEGQWKTASGSICDNTLGSYYYKLSAPNEGGPLPLTSFGIEQQASLVQDAFYLFNGESPVWAKDTSWFDRTCGNLGYKALYTTILGTSRLGPLDEGFNQYIYQPQNSSNTVNTPTPLRSTDQPFDYGDRFFDYSDWFNDWF